MRLKVFLDTNIVLDFMEKDSDGHQVARKAINITLHTYGKPIVSPTTFAICWYYLEKNYVDRKKLTTIAKEIFQGFDFSKETPTIMKDVFASDFKDLEDVLQYYSALDAGASIIITNNVHDFIKPSIPVLHPMEFVMLQS